MTSWDHLSRVTVWVLFRELAADEEERIEKCSSAFRHHLVELNHHAHLAMNEDLRHAVNNVIANVRYHHIEHHGPRLKEVTEKNPLVKWLVQYAQTLTVIFRQRNGSNVNWVSFLSIVGYLTMQINSLSECIYKDLDEAHRFIFLLIATLKMS